MGSAARRAEATLLKHPIVSNRKRVICFKGQCVCRREGKWVEIDVNWRIFFLGFAQNYTNKVRFNLSNAVSRP
jgi:hypothetical protein